MIVAFFYAGFAAWDEEHTKFQAEHDLRIAAENKNGTAHQRTEIIEGLKKFYEEADRLFLSGRSLRTDAVDAQYKLYSEQVDTFSRRLEKWTIDNMGLPARAKLHHISLPTSLTFNSPNLNHNATLKALMQIMENIDDLIKNPEWDKR